MIIFVHLTPWAKKERIEKQIDLMGNEIYRIWLRAKPVGGEANKALIVFLADYFAVRKWQIKIISGATSRQKKIAIEKK